MLLHCWYFNSSFAENQYRTMRKFYLNSTAFFIALLATSLTAGAQVAINTTGAAPDSSAILDVKSSGKGMLIPRMTTAQRMAIANPANGLMVFDTDRKTVATFSAVSGWAMLQPAVPGQLFVSTVYPDPLYPASGYDYMGYDGPITRANLGVVPGEWTGKSIAPGIPGYYGFSYNNRKLCYSGTVSNKIYCIGTTTESDSAIGIYNLTTDTVYKDPLSAISRFSMFTATVDTANARIFIYGGYSANKKEYRGVTYYYNTGVKVPMDSASHPFAPNRSGHSAVWVPSAGRLFIWGGESEYPNSTPANLYAYIPAANNWATLAPCPLSKRYKPLAVYDGNDKILFWGGSNGLTNGPTYYTDGAIYTISTNTWTMMSSTNAPTIGMQSVSWTGTEMLVSNAGTSVANAAAYRYNPAADTWAKLPAIPLFAGQENIVVTNHVWTGTSLALIGRIGISNTGFILWQYNLAANTWSPYSGSVVAGEGSTVTGNDILVQAGNTTVLNISYFYATHYRFNPAASSPVYSDISSVKIHYYKSK
jgi:hypothetical protein